MTTDPGDQLVTLRRGQALTLSFAMDPQESVAGWSLKFTVRAAPGDSAADLIAKTVAAGITLTDAAAGKFDVGLAEADTLGLTPGRYAWDLWRTDSGFEDFLAGGPFEVKQRVRG